MGAPASQPFRAAIISHHCLCQRLWGCFASPQFSAPLTASLDIAHTHKHKHTMAKKALYATYLFQIDHCVVRASHSRAICIWMYLSIYSTCRPYTTQYSFCSSLYSFSCCGRSRRLVSASYYASNPQLQSFSLSCCPVGTSSLFLHLRVGDVRILR